MDVRNSLIILFVIGVLIIVAGLFQSLKNAREQSTNIESFRACVEAGHPVLESYPRQCKTPDGKTFTEDIGDELAKHNLVRITSPRPNTTITSPLVVSGDAVGFWFFEATAPVSLRTLAGEHVAEGFITAEGDGSTSSPREWMTENLVPFEGELQFQTPTSTAGMLILEKANPSGLPENEEIFAIPVKFERRFTED